MFRMPEKQTGSPTVSVCNSPTLPFTFYQSKIPWLFYTFKRKKLLKIAMHFLFHNEEST